jgi:AraC-like DNA-binding protein
MPHTQFILQQGTSKELELFPQIIEFGLRKNNSIQLGSFELERSENLQIFFIIDGKFDWIVNRQTQFLYPGDTALVLPGQEIGGSKGYLEIGTLFWLQLHIGQFKTDTKKIIGKWSNLSVNECLTLEKILNLNNLPVLKVKEVGSILQEMRFEIMNQEIGYQTRVHYMLDSLLILIGRQSTRQAGTQRDFPQAFSKLDQTLRKNLAHQWTVEEMAAMVGLGTTSFTEKVKNYTGFPPLHYLINIRISETIKLLKRSEVNITDIALETGFYSSQHFSTTFKKLTGQTPGEFRKRNNSKI